MKNGRGGAERGWKVEKRGRKGKEERERESGSAL